MPGLSAQNALVPNPGYSQNLAVPATGNQLTNNSQAIAPGVILPDGFLTSEPPIPSAIVKYFFAHRMTGDQALTEWQRRTNFAAQAVGSMVMAYRPVLVAQAAVRYQDRKANIFTARYYTYKIPQLDRSGLIHWDDYLTDSVDPKSVSSSPQATAIYGELSSGMTDPKRISALQKELVDALYNTARLRLPYNPTLKLYANPDVDASEFYAQATQVAREGRDTEIDKVTSQFEKEMDKLDTQLDRKERELGAEHKELADRRREQTFTQGEALLSLLRGRTTYTLSRTSRARRFTRQTEEALSESKEIIDRIQGEMDELENRFERELQAVNEKWVQIANDIQEYMVTPYKKDIHMELFGIGWLPYWYVHINNQPLMLPAF
jgi:hypothetical protein